MSRRSRDEAAAALVVAALDRIDAPERALVLEDPRREVADALAAAGCAVTSWSRRDPGADGAPPWVEADRPRAADCQLVALRLPRAKQELEMLLHLAAGALAPEGVLWIYGANDEGAKSVAGKLSPLFGNAFTLATGGHARLVAAALAADGPAPRIALDSWLEHFDLDLPAGSEAGARRVRWASLPGAFAHGRLDEGTALLLRHLPPLGPGARVLDYGAGTGPLAAGVLTAEPSARVTALEPDALAAAALRLNVPKAEVVTGAGWAPLAGRRWEAVVANPPYHRGKEETTALIAEFLGGLGSALERGGAMRCVVQRRLPFAVLAAAAGLERVEVVADEGPYRVWQTGGP